MITNPNKKHTKHTKLEKPEGGLYHRNEWGIIGAPCDIIQDLAKRVNDQLKDHLKVGFIDTDHKRARRKNTYYSSYTDKISFQSYTTQAGLMTYGHRKFFRDLDLLFVNGNHHIADKQIVIINEDKKESLSRKLDRLTDIKIILLEKSSDEIHDFLIDIIKAHKDIHLFRLDETSKISNAILADLNKRTAPLYGLVLAGGKSSRMGEDKGAMSYHGLPQREYEATLINKYCFRTFISIRLNQDELVETKYEKMYDTFEGLGPYGGILSSMRAHPNAAWLVLACDLPYLDDDTVKQLINSRHPGKVATCFYNPDTDFPEPLITIWEPKAYPILLEYLSLGYSCPRKVLINSDIEMIKIQDVIKMKNVNDVKDSLEAKDYFTDNLPID